MLGEPNNTEDGGTGAGDQRLEGSEGTREDDTGTRADWLINTGNYAGSEYYTLQHSVPTTEKITLSFLNKQLLKEKTWK